MWLLVVVIGAGDEFVHTAIILSIATLAIHVLIAWLFIFHCHIRSNCRSGMSILVDEIYQFLDVTRPNILPNYHDFMLLDLIMYEVF